MLTISVTHTEFSNIAQQINILGFSSYYDSRVNMFAALA